MRSKGRRISPAVLVLAALLAASSRGQAQEDGLLIYLPLDDGKGNTAAASPKGDLDFDGVLENDPAWVEVPGDVPGCGALEFDGVSNFVRIEPDDPFDDPFSPQAPANEGQITICAWVKVLQVTTDRHGQSRQPIVMKGFDGEWEYALYVYDDFGAGMSVWNCGGSGVSEPGAPGTLIPEEWHHVCGTFHVAEGVTVYVDGQEVARQAPNANEPCDGTRPVLIGAREDGQFLNAEIDEVGMWNRVLSADEVVEVMEEGVLPAEPPPPQTRFRRGDCNADGSVNLADPVCTLNWLFGGALVPGCIAALNVNGDPTVNIADAVALLNFLFSGGADPVAPFPDCGPGTAADEQTGCAVPPRCE